MAHNLKPLAMNQEHDCGWVYPPAPLHPYLVTVRHSRRGSGFDVVRKNALGAEVLLSWHATLAGAVQDGDVHVMRGNDTHGLTPGVANDSGA